MTPERAALIREREQAAEALWAAHKANADVRKDTDLAVLQQAAARFHEVCQILRQMDGRRG